MYEKDKLGGHSFAFRSTLSVRLTRKVEEHAVKLLHALEWNGGGRAAGCRQRMRNGPPGGGGFPTWSTHRPVLHCH